MYHGLLEISMCSVWGSAMIPCVQIHLFISCDLLHFEVRGVYEKTVLAALCHAFNSLRILYNIF